MFDKVKGSQRVFLCRIRQPPEHLNLLPLLQSNPQPLRQKKEDEEEGTNLLFMEKDQLAHLILSDSAEVISQSC